MTDAEFVDEAELMARLGLGGSAQRACDFCERAPEQAPPVWVYPVVSLSIELAGMPVELDMGTLNGDWMACQDCAPFLDANDYRGLAQRLGYPQGAVPGSWTMFRRARIGPAQRL